MLCAGNCNNQLTQNKTANRTEGNAKHLKTKFCTIMSSESL